MFQVRRVRVTDAKLIPIHYPDAPTEEGEGVLLKAESPRFSPHEAVDKDTLVYASVHMNMGTQPSKPPGTNLTVVLMTNARSNVFTGGFNDTECQGRVTIQQDTIKAPGLRFFTISIMGSSMGEDEDFELSFSGEQEAADFIRTLLHNWFGYEGSGREEEQADLDEALQKVWAYSSALPDMGSEAQRLNAIHKALRPLMKERGLA